MLMCPKTNLFRLQYIDFDSLVCSSNQKELCDYGLWLEQLKKIGFECSFQGCWGIYGKGFL